MHWQGWIVVSQSDMVGAIAAWAVRQHPYHLPPDLMGVLDRWLTRTEARFSPFGGCRFAWANRRGMIAMLEETLLSDPAVQAWNVPRSGREYNAYVSQFDPEDDFISLDALVRNVVNECYRQHDDTKMRRHAPTREAPEDDGLVRWSEPAITGAEKGHIAFVAQMQAMFGRESVVCLDKGEG